MADPLAYNEARNFLPIDPAGDPRTPVYAEIRREWIRHDAVTPRLLELEAQIKDLWPQVIATRSRV